MQDQIVLLEQRKEVTTFLLDDGDVTSKDVVTETGQNIGYEYTSKLYPEDTVTISDKSEIEKERVCLLICLILAYGAARHLPPHQPDTRQLSRATPARSSA